MKTKSISSLAEEIPYWDFPEQPIPHVILTDNTLVAGFEVTPIDIECFDTTRVNELTLQLRAALNALPESINTQFFLSVDSDYSDIVTKHKDAIAPDSHRLIRSLEESRVSKLMSEIQAASLYRPKLFVFVSTMASDGKRRSPFSKRSEFVEASRDCYRFAIEELNQATEGLKGSLEAAGFPTKTLGRDDYLKCSYQILNPVRSRAEPVPSVRSPQELPVDDKTLAKFPWLALQSPREQLLFGDLVLSDTCFELDSCLHRVVTLKTLPEVTVAGMLSELLRLPFHYKLCLAVHVPPQLSEMAKLNQRRRMAHSLTINNGNKASDLESETRLNSTEELIRELLNTGQKIFAAQLSITLTAPNSSDGVRELTARTRDVLAAFRTLSGAEGMEETVGAWKIFKNQLPAAPQALIRPKRMKTNNLADFLPVFGPRSGDSDPVVVFHNRLHGLVSFNPFDPGLPNYNALVTGSSGAGKSFLNNYILLQQLARKTRVFIIDIGGSYKKLTEALDGQYLEVNLSDKYVINPFDLNGAESVSSQKLKSLCSIVEQMVTEDGQSRLSKLERVLLEKTIAELYQSHKTPFLSDLAKACQQSTEPSLQTVAKLLFSWTGERPYGLLLDRPGGLKTESQICCFDLKGLSSYPDLQSVMILILTDFILSQVEADRSCTKRIILDEAWELLKSPAASQFMEYCARTLRKTGSGITFITQGVEEIVASSIGPAILNNTATKVIMLQRGDPAVLTNSLKLNSQEIELVQSLRSKKGSFSEAFLIEGDHRQVIRIYPQPLDYWLSTSDAADNKFLESLTASGKSLLEAVHEAAKTFPFGISQNDQTKGVKSCA
jgi:conjugal transfer ATP-binding protein TraC